MSLYCVILPTSESSLMYNPAKPLLGTSLFVFGPFLAVETRPYAPQSMFCSDHPTPPPHLQEICFSTLDSMLVCVFVRWIWGSEQWEHKQTGSMRSEIYHNAYS